MEIHQLPSETVKVQMQEETFVVEYPRVAQHINIERAKIRLSDGLYGQLVRTGTISASHSLDYIDMLSFFSVMLGKELQDRMRIKDLSDLKQKDAMLLVREYKSKVEPWLTDWETALRPPAQEESKEESEASDEMQESEE